MKVQNKKNLQITGLESTQFFLQEVKQKSLMKGHAKYNGRRYKIGDHLTMTLDQLP